MLYSVEFVENGTAALCGDDGSRLDISAAYLPARVRPGDLVRRLPDGCFCPAPEATQQRRDRARTLFRKLRR